MISGCTADVHWPNYTVSQKNIPDVFSYNSRKHCRIFLMFDRNITEKSQESKDVIFLHLT